MLGLRESLKNSVVSKERELIVKSDEVSSLAGYERMLAAMLAEHKEQSS
jgi:hypothetical protein